MKLESQAPAQRAGHAQLAATSVSGAGSSLPGPQRSSGSSFVDVLMEDWRAARQRADQLAGPGFRAGVREDRPLLPLHKLIEHGPLINELFAVPGEFENPDPRITGAEVSRLAVMYDVDFQALVQAASAAHSPGNEPRVTIALLEAALVDDPTVATVAQRTRAKEREARAMSPSLSISGASAVLIATLTGQSPRTVYDAMVTRKDDLPTELDSIAARLGVPLDNVVRAERIIAPALTSLFPLPLRYVTVHVALAHGVDPRAVLPRVLAVSGAMGDRRLTAEDGPLVARLPAMVAPAAPLTPSERVAMLRALARPLQAAIRHTADKLPMFAATCRDVLGLFVSHAPLAIRHCDRATLDVAVALEGQLREVIELAAQGDQGLARAWELAAKHFPVPAAPKDSLSAKASREFGERAAALGMRSPREPLMSAYPYDEGAAQRLHGARGLQVLTEFTGHRRIVEGVVDASNGAPRLVTPDGHELSPGAVELQVSYDFADLERMAASRGLQVTRGADGNLRYLANALLGSPVALLNATSGYDYVMLEGKFVKDHMGPVFVANDGRRFVNPNRWAAIAHPDLRSS